MKREQFTFYRSYYEGMEQFCETEWLGYLLAVIRFGLDGEEPEELTSVQKGMFKFVRPILDAGRKKSAAGKQGGRPPKKSKEEKSKEKDKEKIKNKEKIQSHIEEGFLRFWERYPVKLGQQEALDQWERVCEEQDRILEGLERWRNSHQWKRENGRFIPKPEKWLKEHWWLQSPKQVIPMGASGHLGKAELEAIEEVMKN